MKSPVLNENNVIAMDTKASALVNKVISLSSSKKDFISSEIKALKLLNHNTDVIVLTEDTKSFSTFINQSKKGRKDSVSYAVGAEEVLSLVRSLECLVMSRSFLADSNKTDWSNVLVVFDETQAEVWEENDEAYNRLLRVLETSNTFGISCVFVNPEMSVKSLGFGFGAVQQAA